MPTVTTKGLSPDKKIVSISSKRQITIPQKYFTHLGFENEAEIIMRGNELVIRPAQRSSGEFADLILEDLIKQGYTGDELLEKFRETQKKVRPAVEAMMKDALKAAEDAAEYATYEDVFGTEDQA